MPGPRVLIVDDDPSVRGLLRVIADRSGVIADEAVDGLQCLELLDRRNYDLVLLDLSMPRVNGFDVIERLRSKTRRPAVIALTALSRSTFLELDPDIVHCVLRKPFDVDLLMALIVSTATGIYDDRQKSERSGPAAEGPDSGLCL